MPRNRWLGRSIKTAAVIAVAALLIEGALRVTFGFGPIAPRLFRSIADPPGYALQPDLRITYAHFGRRITVTTDHESHRVVPGAQAATGPTLHLIGDSQTFGWGLSDDESVPAQLQRLLGPACRIVNHGVPGYGPFAYVDALSRIPARDFALVIHAEENDLWDLYSAMPPSVARCGYLMPRTFLGQNTPCFIVTSHTFAKLTEWKTTCFDSDRALPLSFNPYTRVAAAVLAYRLQSLYAPFKETRGEKMLMAVVPWDGAIDPSRLAQHIPRLDHAERLTALPDDCRIDDAMRSHPDPASLYFPDDGHLSPAGARLVAQALAPHVRRMLAAPAPAPAPGGGP